ncbi:xylose isomerase [Candidatus Poribacteria bacterium]|nr:xylose isomerase [Candidatus Poribacteria bacterium]
MADIGIGNAPCSWGTLEFEGVEQDAISHTRMLDELRDTGYAGTELGDWGFMPTDATSLRSELASRELAMLAAFVPVAFRDRQAHASGVDQAVRTAELIAAVAEMGNQGRPPYIVLADDNGSDPTRTQNAGRITADMSLSADETATFAAGVEEVARAVLAETGLRCVFHHHCAGYVETPDEIARLLDATDDALVGLVFDTGHYAFGSGAETGDEVTAGLRRFADRVWYMHFKDCDASLAARGRAEGWDYFESVGHGVFCELGEGCVDFPAVADWMRDNYDGWLVVEQDVLPGMGDPKESARRNREYLRGIGL